MYEERYELNWQKIFGALNRFKRTGIVIGMLVMAVMVFGNRAMIPDQYEASTLVRVKMDSAILDNQRRNKTRIVQEEILGRSVLESVIRELGMDKSAVTQKGTLQVIIEKVTGRETTVKPRSMDNIVRGLRSGVSIAETISNGRTNVFMISMKSEYPDGGAHIINAIVNTYIRQKSTSKASDTLQAVEFLEQQVAEKKKAAGVVTKKLQLFKNGNSKYLVSENTLSASLRETKLRLIDAEARLAQSNAMVKDIEETLKEVPATLPISVKSFDTRNIPTDNQGRLAYLQQLLTNYESLYTDKHPKVIKTRREVRALRNKLGVHGTTTKGGTPNPEHITLKTQLATARASGHSAASEVKMIKTEITEFEEILEKQPKRVQIFAALEAAKTEADSEYRTLQGRLADLKLKSQAAQTDVGSNFTVVDPAVMPTSPLMGSRLMLHAFGIILGTGAGLGISLVLGLTIPAPKKPRNSSIVGRVMFYLSSTVVLLVIFGYIVVDFLKQQIVFV